MVSEGRTQAVSRGVAVPAMRQMLVVAGLLQDSRCKGGREAPPSPACATSLAGFGTIPVEEIQLLEHSEELTLRTNVEL